MQNSSKIVGIHFKCIMFSFRVHECFLICEIQDEDESSDDDENDDEEDDDDNENEEEEEIGEDLVV
jgi:hypothetical protein